jgi:cob(I)alamin adenosyltransferase
MSRSLHAQDLYARYQFVRNGVLPGQPETIASFHEKKAHVRRALARDVVQSMEEEHTLHGAPTERMQKIRRVSYTTVLLTPPLGGA